MLIKIGIKDDLGQSSQIMEELQKITHDSKEFEIQFHNNTEETTHTLPQELGAGLTLYYSFENENENENENDEDKLKAFAVVFKRKVVKHLEDTEFKDRLQSPLADTIIELHKETGPMIKTVKEQVVGSFQGVYQDFQNWRRGSNQHTMFQAPSDLKTYFEKKAKAELILGVTAGLLAIPLYFLSPIAMAVAAVTALTLIGFAIFHQTKANKVDEPGYDEGVKLTQ